MKRIVPIIVLLTVLFSFCWAENVFAEADAEETNVAVDNTDSKQFDIDGKTYEATYLDTLDWSTMSNTFKTATFWQLKDAYEDVADLPVTEVVYPYFIYPVEVEPNQVYVIEFEKKDGTGVERFFSRSDEGFTMNGEPGCPQLELPQYVETLTINGKDYEASFYGTWYIGDWSQLYQYRKFWRLENPGDDFDDAEALAEMPVPYNQYPMSVEEGQVYVIQYVFEDGTSDQHIMRADPGATWQNMPTTLLLWDVPHRTDSITVDGKTYEASYFGRVDVSSWLNGYQWREFWRLENAYEDFKGNPKTSMVLPYNNYLMPVEEGQVFAIDYLKNDGTKKREYYRSDGMVWNNMPSTEEFLVKDNYTVADTTGMPDGGIPLCFLGYQYNAGMVAVPVMTPETEITNCTEFTLCYGYTSADANLLGDQRIFVSLDKGNSAWLDCGVINVPEEGEIYQKTITFDKPRTVGGIAVFSKTAAASSSSVSAWIEDVKYGQ